MKHAIATICLIGMIATLPKPVAAQHKLESQTVDAWNDYIKETEKRINAELSNPDTFVSSSVDRSRLKSAPSPQIQEVTIKDVEKGTIHHWRGAIFIPGVSLDNLIAWAQDYDRYEDFYKEVEKSKLQSRLDPNTFDIYLRLARSKMGVTAKYNTNHIVEYRRNGDGRASSRSLATKIAEIKDWGTSSEKELVPGEDRGYLWRLNSYCRFSETKDKDGVDGVIVECETIGLSRKLSGFENVLNWFSFGKVKKIAQSVASESLKDTVVALRDGVRGVGKKGKEQLPGK